MYHAMRDYRFNLVTSLEVHNTLGEGVVWHQKDAAAWWSDIQACTMYRYSPAANELQSWSMPERVGCFGFIDDGKSATPRRLIVAFASGIAYYDLQTCQTEWLARPEADIAGNRFNDGRVDRQGRFWAGTMVEDKSLSCQLGSLYAIDAGGTCLQKTSGITISNGLCWSPDSSVLYHADSPLNQIYAYDFDAVSGAIGNRRVFATTASGCHPDGATVDRDGYLYSAQWGGGCIVRYASTGEVDAVLRVPVSQPTCVAFGGEQLDLMFITSAKEGLSAQALALQPHAGNLLIYQTDFCGLPDPEFTFCR